MGSDVWEKFPNNPLFFLKASLRHLYTFLATLAEFAEFPCIPFFVKQVKDDITPFAVHHPVETDMCPALAVYPCRPSKDVFARLDRHLWNNGHFF